MKGYWFYLKYESPEDKAKGVHSGNCLAVLFKHTGWKKRRETFQSGGSLLVRCYAPCFRYPNAPCVPAAVAIHYLNSRCKRITEKRAREVHPKLFERIEK
jgi:hypothetical protein